MIHSEIKLRPYQEDYIKALRDSFSKGNKRIVLCAPTGSGKTVMFSFMVKSASERQKRCLILTDRKELFSQSNGSLKKLGVQTDLIKPNENVKFESLVTVAMLQTINRRRNKLEYIHFLSTIDLLIIDEAHKQSFDWVFEFLKKDCFVIGATATPFRDGNQREMKEFYNSIIQVIDTQDLIDNGSLNQCKTFGVPVDLKGIKTKGGDYDQQQMGNKFTEMKLYHNVYENYVRIANGKKTIVFCPNVDSSRVLVEDWKFMGLNAKHVDCYMNDNERNDVIDWFKETPGAIISNYGILTTGFDVPDIECVILYRATKSLPLFLQMVGRGSRLSDGKQNFILLDFGNNIQSHGFWEDRRVWSLEKKKKREKVGLKSVKSCPKCSFIVPTKVTECPNCGHKWKQKQDKIKETIDLIELLKKPKSTLSIVELMQIQQAKGYKKAWIYHQFKTLEQFKEYGKIMNYHYKWAENIWKKINHS